MAVEARRWNRANDCVINEELYPVYATTCDGSLRLQPFVGTGTDLLEAQDLTRLTIGALARAI